MGNGVQGKSRTVPCQSRRTMPDTKDNSEDELLALIAVIVVELILKD